MNKAQKAPSDLHVFKVAAFYCFTPFTKEIINFLLKELAINAEEQKVRGTILLALEGVNGTICGSEEGVDFLLEMLTEFLSETILEVKSSWTNQQAFRKFRVRRKAEIVTMGVEGVNPSEDVGMYVEPHDWNAYLSDPATLVIDTRNDYEIGIGTFQGSLNPHTECFRDFPKWVKTFLTPLVKEKKPQRIAMFCTGGIRCEKATSFLRKEGFTSVHHLHGGILRYLEEVPENESFWDGECFVFDQRVALDHNLLPGDHRLCHACGMPLNSGDRSLDSYVRGVQCRHCEHSFTDQDRVRFAERQRQFDLRSQQPEKARGF